MRVIGAIILSMVIALPALAQIGIRTAQPTRQDTKTEAGAGDGASADTGEIWSMRRDDMDEDRVPERDEEATTTRPETTGADTPTTNQGTPTGTTPAAGTATTTPAATPNPADCKVRTGAFPTKKPVPGGGNPTLCLFNQFGQEYLKYGRIVNSSKATSATMEIAADAFGPIRVTISSAVSTATNDDDEEPSGDVGTDAEGDTDDDDEPTSSEDQALNLLSANGGNLAITAALPLYYKPFLGGGMFLWNSYARVGGNVQAFNENDSTVEWNDSNGSLELAFSELHLDMLGAEKEKALNLLGYAKTSMISGTKAFADAIGAESRTFLHAQLGAGLRVADKFTVFFTYNWYSDDKIPGGGGAITLSMGK